MQGIGSEKADQSIAHSDQLSEAKHLDRRLSVVTVVTPKSMSPVSAPGSRLDADLTPM